MEWYFKYTVILVLLGRVHLTGYLAPEDVMLPDEDDDDEEDSDQNIIDLADSDEMSEEESEEDSDEG